MRILSFDPGAERLGYAVIDGDGKTAPKWIDSGIIRCHRRKDEDFQPYKLRLISYLTIVGPKLFNDHKPDVVVSEIVPVVGGGNFVVATQSQLASAAITTLQTLALEREMIVTQVGATTVKAKIGGKQKATKVGVRNGMIQLLPELAPRKFEWTKEFDESDALAIGLTYLGYSNIQKVF